MSDVIDEKGKKQLEEERAFKKPKLPNNKIKPIDHRIFAIAVDPGDVYTNMQKKILKATSFAEAEAKGDMQVKKMYRFFVVDVSEDISNFEIKRGVEIFPFFPARAIDWDFVEVWDWENNGEQYIVFHETEIAGVEKR